MLGLAAQLQQRLRKFEELYNDLHDEYSVLESEKGTLSSDHEDLKAEMEVVLNVLHDVLDINLYRYPRLDLDDLLGKIAVDFKEQKEKIDDLESKLEVAEENLDEERRQNASLQTELDNLQKCED